MRHMIYNKPWCNLFSAFLWCTFSISYDE